MGQPAYDDGVMRGPSDPRIFVIRPSWRRVFPTYAVALSGLMLMALFIVVAAITGRLVPDGHWTASAIIGVGSLACGLVFFSAHLLYTIDGASITLLSDRIIYRRWFRVPVDIPLSQMTRVHRCSVWRGPAILLYSPAVFVLSREGRCLLSLYAMRWNPADLDRIWSRAQATVEGSFDDRVSPFPPL